MSSGNSDKVSRLEKAVALATIATFGVLIWQVNDQVQATKSQTNALWSSTYQGIMERQLELDNIFIEDPDLDLFFYKQDEIREKEFKEIQQKNQKEGKTDETRKYERKAEALASYYLDFFTFIWSQRDFLPTLQNLESEEWKSFEGYMAATFENSRVLCNVLERDKESYYPPFIRYVKGEDREGENWCPNNPQL